MDNGEKKNILENKKTKLSFYNNMKLKFKLSVSFGIVVILILILAGVFMSNNASISHQTQILSKVTEATNNLSLARVEQVRFEADGNLELRDKVNANLDTMIEMLQEAKLLMKSVENKNNVESMIGDVNDYHDAFKSYVDLEVSKDEQGAIRVNAAGNVIKSIRETLTLETEYIKSLNSAGTIQSSYDKYLLLQDAFDYYMEVRVSANKYVMTGTDGHAEELLANVAATKERLERAKKIVLDNRVLAQIDIALENLNDYKVAFDNYRKLLVEQEDVKDEMRAKALTANEMAVVIEKGVEDYISTTEKQSTFLGIFISIFAVIISLVVANILTFNITRGINLVVKNMNAIASFKLTEQIPQKYLLRKDEIGVLAKATEGINKNLLEIVGKLDDTSNILAESSRSLSEKSSFASQTSSEISMTIEEIANGASHQAESTEMGAGNVHELGQLIENDKLSVKKLIDSADNVKILKDEGVETINQLVMKTEESNQSTGHVYKIIEETNESADRIEKASKMIQSITDQTNLLALNAAIEAARAGEAGRGFSVVADEIRELAEQSNEFTKEIMSTISELISKSTEAVETMKMAKDMLELQSKDVSTTNEKFIGIANAIEDMKNVIEEIHESSIIMEEKKISIVEVMEGLAGISEENAASTEETLATIVEQSNSIDGISKSMKELDELSSELKTIIARFEI